MSAGVEKKGQQQGSGKDHPDDLDGGSWRNSTSAPTQSHHHQQPYGTSADYYYNNPTSFYPQQYSDTRSAGPWSSGSQDAFNPYESYEAQMFGGGGSTPFSFQQQQNFGGYSTPGYGDYSTWGGQRKQYEEGYYRDSYDTSQHQKDISNLTQDLKDFDLHSSGGKKTWASIASQPAKPQSIKSKKGSGAIPMPPPIMLGWEKNGGGKVPAPVQAPTYQQWGDMGHSNQVQSHAPGAHTHTHTHAHPTYVAPPPMQAPPQHMTHPPQQQTQRRPPPLAPIEMKSQSAQRYGSGGGQQFGGGHHSIERQVAVVQPSELAQAAIQYPDEAKIKSEYNPTIFDLNTTESRFFVIKSYSEDDIHRSIKYEIWCSTEHGNKRLDTAFREREGKGPIYLFFSVNSSGHFCGMAQMMSAVDYEASSSVWSQDKWKGQFKVKWIYVKDVPNNALRQIKLENNEMKSVTNSRDTQEVPLEKGKQVLKILHTYHHVTSIFDDFVHYEKRQEEEEEKRVVPEKRGPDRGPDNMRGRGDHHSDRGGRDHHSGPDRGNNFDRGHPSGGHGGMDRDRPQGQGLGRRNDFRDDSSSFRSGGRDGFGGQPRDQQHSRGGGGFLSSRGGAGGGGGGGGPPRGPPPRI